MLSTLLYWRCLLGKIFQIYAAEGKRTVILSAGMFTQDFMFLALYWILFNNFESLGGWRLKDAALLFGISVTAIGLILFLCRGLIMLPYKIYDGSIDIYLARPRHPLVDLTFGTASFASLGDILCGLVLIAYASQGFSWAQGLLCLFLVILGAVIFWASLLVFYCIPFWLLNAQRLSDQLFEMMIIASFNMLHGQPLGIKIILFTLVPAGFVAYLPTLLLMEFDPLFLALIMMAAVFYAFLAVKIFESGVRRYLRG
ncbi:MAG: ABC-2 family transporter protein [Alphaproteobacteria bacterium]|nr:ABC-2 family transporter protein [Alphaproteobacteria bacterium]